MMRETGFSSPRHDSFPVGLRVLVVDDDPTWLKILEKMLKKCCYEVTTCSLAREALRLLRERKDGYDIVISDVNMPDMDGFKLLEHVGLEMDLPVIMMSVDGETSRVMKGVQHGACDYLLKPIGIKELRNIWQHVFRKKIHEGPDGYESAHIRSFLEQSDEGFFLGGEEVSFGKKRKEVEYRPDDRDSGDSSSTKKARVVWSVELHKKFVSAVNQIGYDKVGPKKILDLMNVPWLTRENVASHLQKYRLYLSRLPIEGEPKPCFGESKLSDSHSKDVGVNFDHQASTKIQADEVLNKCGSSGGNSNPNPKPVDPEGSSSTPVSEPDRSLRVDVRSRRKAKRTETGYKQSLLPFRSDVMNFKDFDSTQVPTQFTWSEVRTKLEFKPSTNEDSSNQLPPTNPQPVTNQLLRTDQLPLTKQHPYIMNAGLYFTETDIKPPPENQSMNQTIPPSPDDFLQVQAKNRMVMNQDFKLSIPPTMKVQDFSTHITENAELISRNLNWGTLSAFPAPLDDDLQLRWLQHDILSANLGLQNIDATQHDDPGFVSEFPNYLQEAMRFENFEHCYDPAEYPLVDQGLFIT